MQPQPRANTAPPPGQRGLEDIGLFAIGAVIVAMLLLWLTGELAALVFSGRAAGVDFGQMGRVLVRLPGHLADPARAWPRGTRSSLPGPMGFYGVFGALLVIVTFLAIVTVRLFRGTEGKRRDERSAQWASSKELAPLVVKGPQRGRLILGRNGRLLLAAEKKQSVIVLGPTQSGKTTGFAIPALLEWDGPVIATSIKTDLLRDTMKARARRGRVHIYDPNSTTRLEGSLWSPLQYCTTWRGAQKTASWLAGAARTDGTGIEDSNFWYASAAKLLGPLLFAAATSERTMADVVRWVDTQEETEVRLALEAAAVPEALNAAGATWAREERQRSSIYTTAETVLQAYADPNVLASAMGSDITPDDLLDSDNDTLYVVAPSHEQRRLRPLFETLIQSVIARAFERASLAGGTLDPPLLIVLDEAANIAPLRDLDTLASTAASHGIQIVSIFQDFAQIADRYADRANTVLNNHSAKLILSGISDPQALEYVSRLLGDEELMQSSVTVGDRGTRSTTQSVTHRSLAPAHLLRSIRPGEGVLVYRHLPPARLTLRPWFKERHLAELARGEEQSA